MNKVAIVTIISKNYGNRLQNFALQEALINLGNQVKTIPAYPYHIIRHKIKYFAKKALNALNGQYPDVVWDEFDKKIKWGKAIMSDKRIADKYDYFIAGSDQIWNPLFDCNSDRELLTFAENQKKIAYAASFGVDKLPSEIIKHYHNEIITFKAVSVREFSAANIIEQLGCDRPVVVLDPTMLLNDEQWIKIAKQSKVKFNKKHYAVVYFLGKRNKDYDEYILRKIKDNKLELIDIMSPSSEFKNSIGPAEFVSLLYNCDFVFTDSFHGTVFSILFHKPFIVFERPYEDGYGKMTSRLDTLLSTFKLDNHRVFDKSQLESIDAEWNIHDVNNILNRKREESISFLKKALDI